MTIFTILLALIYCDHSRAPPDPHKSTGQEWNGCWCSLNDGDTWPAREDGLCYLADRKKK